MNARTMGLVAVAALAIGCGSESCPTESAAVKAMQQTCTAAPGAQVPIRLTLCPTCNQSLTSCTAQPAGTGTILLDPIVEACSSNVCEFPPGCDFNSTCTFQAPTQDGTYTIQVLQDPNASPPKFFEATLNVVSASGTPGCS